MNIIIFFQMVSYVECWMDSGINRILNEFKNCFEYLDKFFQHLCPIKYVVPVERPPDTIPPMNTMYLINSCNKEIKNHIYQNIWVWILYLCGRFNYKQGSCSNGLNRRSLYPLSWITEKIFGIARKFVKKFLVRVGCRIF